MRNHSKGAGRVEENEKQVFLKPQRGVGVFYILPKRYRSYQRHDSFLNFLLILPVSHHNLEACGHNDFSISEVTFSSSVPYDNGGPEKFLSPCDILIVITA